MSRFSQKVPLDACCPELIINGTPPFTVSVSCLEDKSYAHPRDKMPEQKQISPGPI